MIWLIVISIVLLLISLAFLGVSIVMGYKKSRFWFIGAGISGLIILISLAILITGLTLLFRQDFELFYKVSLGLTVGFILVGFIVTLVPSLTESIISRSLNKKFDLFYLVGPAIGVFLAIIGIVLFSILMVGITPSPSDQDKDCERFQTYIRDVIERVPKEQLNSINWKDVNNRLTNDCPRITFERIGEMVNQYRSLAEAKME